MPPVLTMRKDMVSMYLLAKEASRDKSRAKRQAAVTVKAGINLKANLLAIKV